MQILKRLKEWIFRNAEHRWQPVCTDNDGFSVGPRRMEWEQVQSITAFKRDHITVDDVWFEVEGFGEPILVCEEQPGFSEWESELGRRFPSARRWQEQIIQPAFAENLTVLYRRT